METAAKPSRKTYDAWQGHIEEGMDHWLTSLAQSALPLTHTAIPPYLSIDISLCPMIKAFGVRLATRGLELTTRLGEPGQILAYAQDQGGLSVTAAVHNKSLLAPVNPV